MNFLMMSLKKLTTFLSILLVSLVSYANAQVISRGTCPGNINVTADFQVDQYLGLWYEFAKYPAVFEANGKCNTALYSLQSDGNVSVLNTMVDEKTGVSSDIQGNATVVENAKLLVTFPVSHVNTVSSNYWVLDTDYTSYAVVYSCQPLNRLNRKHAVFVWILTRESQPDIDTISKGIAVLLNSGISLRELEQTNQTDCDSNTVN